MNKKHWLRSALSLLMALCLVLGTPVAALAAEDYCSGAAQKTLDDAVYYVETAQIVVDIIVDTIDDYDGVFTGSSSQSFVKTVAVGKIEDVLAEPENEKLMVGLGFKPEDKSMVAEELYDVACVYYDEAHRTGGTTESANKLAVVELIRFTLVKTKGYSDADAQKTAEYSYDLYQIYKTEGEETALAKAAADSKQPHVDENKDHKCDNCGKADMSNCIDADKDRVCDACGKELCETCVDKDPADHICDVCKCVLGTCEDADKDHACDVCDKELSKCADEDKDHLCDVCETKLSECADADKDHLCDVCDKELTECTDEDKDHACDICDDVLSECEDKDKDGKCDLCGESLVECVDEDKDHKCDDCGKELTECADADKNHKCDICGERLSACEDADKDGKCDVCGEQVITQKVVTRISGKERTATARKIADEVKTVLAVEKFDAIVYASGDAFPDALTGTYLANVENAPILLYRASGAGENLEYIKKNLAADGVVYILGGEKAVPVSVEADLKTAGIKAVRLSGKTRFDTNIEILEAAGFVGGETVLVCTGYEYADSLSASATGMPILLVNNAAGKLTDAQSAYLKGLDAKCEFVVIGGEGAVSAALAKELAVYDADGTVARLSGKTRYETSVKLAETYLPKAEKAILAYGREFADGLCGGSLGYALDAPIILVESGKASVAAEYAAKQGIVGGYVLGGTARVADATVRTVFALADTDQLVAK